MPGLESTVDGPISKGQMDDMTCQNRMLMMFLYIYTSFCWDFLPSPLLLDTPQDVNPLLNHGFSRAFSVFFLNWEEMVFFSMNIQRSISVVDAAPPHENPEADAKNR